MTTMTGQEPTDRETTYAQQAGVLRVWFSFVKMFRAGQISSIPLRPYLPALLEPLQAFLNNRYRDADWREWEAQPEVHRVENQVHFLLNLTANNERDTYNFSFLLEDGHWYLQHVESITLRLDRLEPLPTSRFPDLPETKKAWMREEARVSEMVRLFQLLSQEKGQHFALDWFLDGEGYALAVRTWVPFLPAHQAFILYLCWEQANLYGAATTLIELTDEIARVEIEPLYFKLYRCAGHLKQQISFNDYRCLFQAIWTDRSIKSGWQVELTYQAETCEMLFRRNT